MLQILFRAAHTLKGSSRAMGFLAVGDLTHEMENILDDLRNDQLEVTTPIVNALLDCLDALGGLVDAVADFGDGHGQRPTKTFPTLVARLNALRAGSPDLSDSEPIRAARVRRALPSSSFSLADHELSSVGSGDRGGTVGLPDRCDCCHRTA